MMVLMNLVTVKRRNWVEVKELQQNMDEYDMLRMKGEDFGASAPRPKPLPVLTCHVTYNFYLLPHFLGSSLVFIPKLTLVENILHHAYDMNWTRVQAARAPDEAGLRSDPGRTT